MRIDLYNSTASQLNNDSDAKQVKSQDLAVTDATESGDRTTLTSGSVSVSSLVSQAMNSPEVRQDKVESLQQAVRSGKYQLEPENIAGAMIDEHA
jgi:flagellar biosynthesis anti-sigma factor FlgM